MRTSTFIFALAVLARGQDAISLREAVRQSMARSKVMEASGASRDAARARVAEARAGFLLKVNYWESWTRSDNPVFVFSSLLTQRQFSESHFDVASLNRPDFLNNFQSLVTADQALYDAGRTKRAVRMAKLDEDLSHEDSRRSQWEVVAQVVRFYWDTQLGAEEVNVTAQAMRSAEADLERAEARRASGMATDADVLSIRVHLAGVREEQIRRSADLEVARAAMNDAIGLPLDSAHSLTTPLTPLPVTQTELSGYAREVRAQIGDHVRGGQALVVLDARDLETSVARAKAGREEVRSAISEAESGVALARSQLDLAQVRSCCEEMLVQMRPITFANGMLTPGSIGS